MKWFRLGEPTSEEQEWERIQAEVRTAIRMRMSTTLRQRRSSSACRKPVG
jgi:hypothetical protein